MKRWFATLFVAVIAAGIGLGVLAQSEGDDAAMAASFFEEFQAAPYTDWPFEPGVPAGFYIGTEPHGMILRSFINDVAAADLENGASVFSEGAILVKENHMPGDVDVASMEAQDAVEGFEGQLAVITYMVKVPGYNPDGGDWFWGRQQPDGTIDAAGKVAGCIGCHTQVADNDWVFNTSLTAVGGD